MPMTGDEKKGAQVFGVALMVAAAVVAFFSQTIAVVLLVVGWGAYAVPGHGGLIAYLWVEGYADICRERFGAKARGFSPSALFLWPVELLRRAVARLAPDWYRQRTWGDFGGRDHGVRSQIAAKLEASPHPAELVPALRRSHEVLVRLLHPDSPVSLERERLEDVEQDLPMEQAHAAIVGLLLRRERAGPLPEPLLKDLFAAAGAFDEPDLFKSEPAGSDAMAALRDKAMKEITAKANAERMVEHEQRKGQWEALARILRMEVDELERARQAWEAISRHVTKRWRQGVPPELPELFAQCVEHEARRRAGLTQSPDFPPRRPTSAG